MLAKIMIFLIFLGLKNAKYTFFLVFLIVYKVFMRKGLANIKKKIYLCNNNSMFYIVALLIKSAIQKNFQLFKMIELGILNFCFEIPNFI